MRPHRRRPFATPAALAAATLACLCVASPANAAGAQTGQLCSDDRVRCSVQAPPRWVDGTAAQVGITGRPDSTVELQVFRVSSPRGTKVDWEPVGAAVDVTTDDQGWGSVEITLPALAAGRHGGPLVVAPAESEGQPLGEVLGAWSALVSATPEVLGDGWTESKPAGVPLTLALDHVSPGTVYAVQRQDGTGWVTVASNDGARAPEARATCEHPTCTLTYVVPRGLDAGVHTFRLVDVRRGAPVATWKVRPGAEGQKAQAVRAEVFEPLGQDVEGAVAAGVGVDSAAVVRPRSRNLDVPLPTGGSSATSVDTAHSVAAVRWAAVAATVAALALALCPGRLRPSSTGSRR
ncbi:hypothetical protein [Nocardioides jishulii]|uniref:Uncharacterized protein n=1 Tax=Nocardioides jishulii TaxID=2575440 RepID=A0A4U2YJP5_9ACTN|nr:hypothetical protein [Nocardioides jishulii]QCX28240.1 hypothetical protein FCL41_12445 [Nocardioides jishulii]TKI60904.1 hypothetical protein FC770_15515 [Nocardioides jishulii]